MNIIDQLCTEIESALAELYNFDSESETPIQLNNTRKDLEGDITLVVFPLLRISKKSPEITGHEIGEYVSHNLKSIDQFNVIKGFLNFVIKDEYWLKSLDKTYCKKDFGFLECDEFSDQVMIEYSSPNTNKPLHLGHIRNNLLGFSIAEILKANGKNVVKTNIVNDRGIHICKSMYAWKEWGNGETPQSSGKKGDHLVGDYYVEFNNHYKQEVEELINQGMDLKEAEEHAPSMVAVRKLLRKWEARDEKTIDLWAKMNGWVYEGFDTTYKNLGVDFDKIYYESETYLVGKEEVLRGLKEGIFFKKDDGSVWADLKDEGMDEKLLLRSDGTSVYITQDIGTAKMRFEDYEIDKMIYVVGNEQNYHFQVLAIILDKLGYNWGKDLYHFSYGMVELPSGKMKSREGTVVDADDLMAGMIDVARETSNKLGKLDKLSKEDAEETYRKIAMGALKYFMLKVDPRKNMLFNPEESIDFNGNTGPFIQYTYARIRSVLRKAVQSDIKIKKVDRSLLLSEKEKQLLKTISLFPEAVHDAGDNYNPAAIANYCYDLVKEYNQFYHDHSILNEDDQERRNFRLQLSNTVAKVIQKGMKLLGIEMPERM